MCRLSAGVLRLDDEDLAEFGGISRVDRENRGQQVSAEIECWRSAGEWLVRLSGLAGSVGLRFTISSLTSVYIETNRRSDVEDIFFFPTSQTFR